MEGRKLVCPKCGEEFELDPASVYFDDHGYGYSTKLVNCTHCLTPNVLRYYNDVNLDINNDIRYYNY